MLIRILFWNVDTQRDFINKDGALYIPGAEKIKPTLQYLTSLAKKFNLSIVNTLDFHKLTDAEISTNPNFKTTFPIHCKEGTEGVYLIPETDVKNGDFTVVRNLQPFFEMDIWRFRNILIFKNKFDVFTGNEHTLKVLKGINPKIVVVYGVATDVCVDFAVKGLLNFGCQVIVVEDGIKELPNADVEAIYNGWEQHGVIIWNVDVLRDFLTILKKEDEDED